MDEDQDVQDDELKSNVFFFDAVFFSVWWWELIEAGGGNGRAVTKSQPC